MANTGYKEIEQVDRNPNSPTFNQKRWVNGGSDLALCPLPEAPDTAASWQDTGLMRCQVTNGNNTGYQEKQQKDVNSQSATYNQTRWVQSAYNTVACPVAQSGILAGNVYSRQSSISAACGNAVGSTTPVYTENGTFDVNQQPIAEIENSPGDYGTLQQGYYRVFNSQAVIEIDENGLIVYTIDCP